jgi:hypothetical protein
MIRQHDPREPEEGRGSYNRAEIVRIADPVEQQQRLAAACPVCRRVRSLGEIEDRHRLRAAPTQQFRHA